MSTQHLPTTAAKSSRFRSSHATAVLFAALALVAQSVSAATVTLGNFAANGLDTADTITLNANLGGTRSYGTYVGTVRDGGIHSAVSPVTLAQVGDKLTYSFAVATPTVNGDGPSVFRSGFALFDGTATNAHLHFQTGVGTATDARFAANTNNNRYSGGTQVGTTSTTFFNDPSLRFNDGNASNVTFTLTLTANNVTTFDFLFNVDWSSGTATNSISQSFTGIATNKVVGMYHLTNSVIITSGSSFVISNAAADFTAASAIPEPSTFAALAGLGVLGLAISRRRPTRGSK